jgi:hypothetical protein
MGKNFPFSIADIAGLLPIENQRKKAESIDANCPFCFKKRKFNMNFVNNTYRCNYCGADGGMLDLYMQFHHDLADRSDAYHAICRELRVGADGHWDVPARKARLQEPEIPKSKLAMPWELHRTYSFLFSLLNLSPKHRQDLLRRGLTGEQIERFGYKSTPAYGFTVLADKVIKQGFTVAGVPGFYENENGQWTVRFHAKTSGIIIPVLSAAGQIQGAQIRLDRPFDGRKYMWFSSSEKLMGVGPGSPVHFVGPLNVKTVCVTEGGLKGTIAHCLTGWTFACLAGAGQYANFAKYLPYLKSCGVEEIAVAYDMDLLDNEKVRDWCVKLLCSIKDAGLDARLMKWDPVNKGVDDHYWAKALKLRLTGKLENELQMRGSEPNESELYGNLCTGIRENGINVKPLAFLCFMELPLVYLLRKTEEFPDAPFMELMAAVSRDIPKDF